MIAIVLAAGAVYWGSILLLAFSPAVLLPVTLFGFGYIVLVGYVIRAATCPALGVRRAIWVASLAVQGAWLLTVGIPDLPPAGPTLFFWWWAFATAASAVALLTERGSADAEPVTAADGRLGSDS